MTGYLGPYELNTIVTGDARELAKAIPDESVDLIFTDPVYDRIDDYRWLAETAARVLKPGGSIIAQAGHLFLYSIQKTMSVYLLLCPLLMDYYEFSRMNIYKYNLQANVKFYVWCSKGNPLNNWIIQAQTSYKSQGRLPNGRPASKMFHDWGDHHHFILKRIKAFTHSGAVIFDPFTGGGTVPAVCKMLQRNYLAFEIDPTTAQMARDRVANTQPPLPLVMPVQEALL